MSRRKRTVGLDLGTSRVAVVIAESDDPGTPVTIIGVGEAPSDGLRKGVVVNLEKTIASIQAAAVAAERMAGQRIESVVVSLAGGHLYSQNSTGVVAVARPDHEIGEDDVQRVVEASRAVSVASDRQVIHVIPRAYTVDGQDGVRDAVGMTGHRLEVETNIITGAQTAVQNVIKCVHGAGFDIEDVVCCGLAAGEGVLTPQEVDLGVCLVEIGAGTTAVVVYNEGSARHLAVLPVGGNHVTSDIAIGLRTTLDEAESLKLNYGHTLPDVIDHGEKVEVRQVGGDRIQALPRRFLAEIIGPRMREIFQMARDEVRKSGFDGLLPAGVVVTGGGARLMGTTDAAQAVFDTSVRLGQPLGMSGLADRAQGPSFAVSVGLVKWGSRAPARGYASARQQQVTIGSTYQKTVRWLRDFSRDETRNQLELAIAKANLNQEDVVKESLLHEGRARIKVVGCGGGGGNAVNRMISKALKVEFIAVNTDKQALERCQADVKVQMGNKITRGLGAGGDWTRGRDAADESRTELSAVVQDSDMVFITCGMGGGTGTGSAAIVAELAKESGALTIGVVTRPFGFEGRVRNETAEEGIKSLRSQVDALIVIPNDRLAQVANSKTTLEDAFRMADDVLRQGVQGISDLVTNPGVINLDFADVKAIMENAGEALMGIGHGAGDSRAEDAAKQAVSSPLLETSIDGAKGILFNITAGKDITLQEVQKAAEIVRAAADPSANIIFGVVRDDTMQGEIKITVIATGFGAKTSTEVRHDVQRKAIERERPEFGTDDISDINIPAFLRNRM